MNYWRGFARGSLVLLVGVVLLGGAAIAQTGTLRIGIETSLGSMDPMGNAVTTSLSAMRNVYDGFFERATDGTIVPGLVESWERVDQLTWRLHVRKGVSFHNGNPLTASDLKFTLERTSTYERSEYQEVGGAIQQVDLIDDYTLDVVTKNPNPIFPSSIYSLTVMDEEWTTSNDDAYVSTHAMGTGAYTFVEWVPEDHLTLEANADYWRGAPSIERVIFQPISDEATRLAALESGDVDLITFLPIENIDRLQDSAEIEVIAQPADRMIFLGFEHSEGFPTADLRVRQAMYMAINIDEIIGVIFDGYATPATTIVAGPESAYPGFDGTMERQFEYDPVRARELLEEAGYPNGFEITLDSVFDRYPKDEQVSLAVTTYLRQVGIECLLNVRSRSVHFGEIMNAETDFWLTGWREGSYDLYEAFGQHILTRDPNGSQGGWNAGWYSNQEVDRLCAEANQALSADERADLLKQANRIAMEEIAVLPLYAQYDIYGARAGLIDFTPRSDMYIIVRDISFK